MTRALCWTVIVTAVVAVPLWIALIASIFLGNGDVFGLVGTPLLCVFLLHVVASIVLAVWRSCDRCEFHLYPWQGPLGPTGKVRRVQGEERYPDHRAERFLGAWRWGGIVSMATKGTAHCVWCGHADGAKLPTQ